MPVVRVDPPPSDRAPSSVTAQAAPVADLAARLAAVKQRCTVVPPPVVDSAITSPAQSDGDPFNTKYPGRFAGSRALLQQYWFQPTVAYRLSPNQGISVGVAFVRTHLFLEQSFLNPYDTKPTNIGFKLAQDVFPDSDPQLAYNAFVRLLPEGRLRAAADANKFGITAGYLYKHRSPASTSV